MKVHPHGVFHFPSYKTCSRELYNITKPVKHMSATVYQFSPKTTKFPMYHCELQKVTYTCYTKFFGSKNRQVKTEKILVSPEDCRKYWSTKLTPYGPLQEQSPGRWLTLNRDQYTCSWLKHKSHTCVHFSITAYDAIH